MKVNIVGKTCRSADKPIEKFVSDMEFETAHHRMKDQSIKCGFGLQGVCCTLCANGPCRISEQSPRGVCGANADSIVARNFLRTVAGGSASYLHIVENVARDLMKIGQTKGIIRGEQTLNMLSDSFGIEGKDKYEKAEKLGRMVLDDLYKPRHEKMELVEKMAYSPRFENWSKLDILPGGAKSEVFNALVKTSTNLNTDPIDLLFHTLSLGIATGLYGLTLSNLLNDIMLGEPKIRTDKVGFHVIDTDYINIMITGHQHALINNLQETLITDEAKNRAKEAGARGFKILGTTCVGQDIQLRGEHYQEVFAGHCGNNFTTEPLVATGAVDLIVSEFNCTFPGLEPIARRQNVKMICIDDVAKKSSADLMQYSYEEREEISYSIIEEALKSYRARRDFVDFSFPENHGNSDTITGVSEQSLKEFLGGSYKPILELLGKGDIKGIVGVVGCSNLMSGGHDVFTVELTKRLIADDILVLSAGCSSGALANTGLMTLEAADLAGANLRAVCKDLKIPPVLNFGPCLAIGRLEMVATELAKILRVDVSDLPLIISAPQWLEEQAVADGVFALTLGLPLHVAKPLHITGGHGVTDLLEEGLKDLTGGRLIMDDDVDSTMETFNNILLYKRKSLGI